MRWLVALLLLAACQQPTAFAPGSRHLCPVGYHWVTDSLQYHNVCVVNT